MEIYARWNIPKLAFILWHLEQDWEPCCQLLSFQRTVQSNASVYTTHIPVIILSSPSSGKAAENPSGWGEITTGGRRRKVRVGIRERPRQTIAQNQVSIDGWRFNIWLVKSQKFQQFHYRLWCCWCQSSWENSLSFTTRAITMGARIFQTCAFFSPQRIFLRITPDGKLEYIVQWSSTH